jgi:hypothetical protein
MLFKDVTELGALPSKGNPTPRSSVVRVETGLELAPVLRIGLAGGCTSGCTWI